MDIRPGIDAAFVRRLAAEQGWTWTDAEVRARLAPHPEGAFTAVGADGALLGTARCVVWPRDDAGALAWIGTMLVERAHRRQGIGSALLLHALDHARAHGATTVALDATDEARRLYEREGFRAVARTALWTRDPATPLRPPGPSGEFAIYPVSSAEMMELNAYDKTRFGANRGPLLAELMASGPHASFVAVHRRTGRFSGLVLPWADRIGPLVADAPEAAAWLLHAIERAGRAPKVVVWTKNPHAARVLAAAGYVDTGRGCTRMVLGDDLPMQDDAVYGVAHYALG